VDFIDSNSFWRHPLLGDEHSHSKEKPSRKGWVSSSQFSQLPFMMMMTMMVAVTGRIRGNNRTSQNDKSDNTQQNIPNLHV
jgi:hypothetical protein